MEVKAFSIPDPSLNNNNIINNNNNVVYNNVHANNNNNTNNNSSIVNEHHVVGMDIRKYFDSFPPGIRFCPFDHELIVHYLKNKISNQPMPPNKIQIVDHLYLYTPQTLTEMHPGLWEKEWYFFTPRFRKYRNGARPNRAAGTGYWKDTGADRSVKHKGGVVGSRKVLVFYEGRSPFGEKTSWIMHEYRVVAPPRSKMSADDMRLDNWVLCRVYNKAVGRVPKQDEHEEAAPFTAETEFWDSGEDSEHELLVNSNGWEQHNFLYGDVPTFHNDCLEP